MVRATPQTGQAALRRATLRASRSAQDKRDHQRLWGRALKGVRTTSTAFFSHRGKRHTVLPIMSFYGGLVDWAIFEGGLDIPTYLEFINNVAVLASSPPLRPALPRSHARPAGPSPSLCGGRRPVGRRPEGGGV